MKKFILSTLYFLISLQLLAQTEGISYQAVIIGPDKQELPGVDAVGNILPNATIAIRFTILDGTNTILYQEVQTTKTDKYGRINLLIGKVDHDKFTSIDWNGTAKDLKVEINFTGTGTSFVDMSREQLNFLPYSYHRNITARGNLVVNGLTDLNGELKVAGPTNLNSTLNVNDSNATNLSGSLTVKGPAMLNNGITAGGTTKLDSLDIAGDMKVTGAANFTGPAFFKVPSEFNKLTVNGPASLKGQVTIDANVDSLGDDIDYNAYPLLIQGSAQGIAIKVSGILNPDDDTTSGTHVPMSTVNNFISFWDAKEDKMWGRIEGQSIADLVNDRDYKRERNNKGFDILLNAADLGIAIADVVQKTTIKLPATFTSSTACLGVGACVTAPIPSLIVEASFDAILHFVKLTVAVSNLALAVKEEIEFISGARDGIGVTYQSGAGDYAEWLPKLNASDIFSPGEIVGIKNGAVTKNTWACDKIMIVSTRPIVLGNMPQQKDESKFVRIAFMGQVPATVLGNVIPGDYILPSEAGSGFAKAVHPADMKSSDYKKAAGIAWNTIDKLGNNLNIVNVAVGINTNDLSNVVIQQEQELAELRKNYDQLQSQVRESNIVLSNLVPGYAKALGLTETNLSLTTTPKNGKDQHKITEQQILKQDGQDIVYFQISDEQIKTAIQMAREKYIEMVNNPNQFSKLLSNSDGKMNAIPNNMILIPIEDHPFWKRIDSDPSDVEEVKNFIQSGLNKGIHTHKQYADKFSTLKVSQ